jgi:hypothetical protein
MNSGFRIFAMHMENGDHEHFSHIRGVSGGAGIFGKRCISDLVIDDQMDCAAGFIACYLRHIKGFGYNTLTGKGCVAMD